MLIGNQPMPESLSKNLFQHMAPWVWAHNRCINILEEKDVVIFLSFECQMHYG